MPISNTIIAPKIEKKTSIIPLNYITLAKKMDIKNINHNYIVGFLKKIST
jgi:hypothetical protein